MLLSAGVVFHCLWYFLYITVPLNLHAKKLQLLPPRLSLLLSNSLPLPVQLWGKKTLATLPLCSQQIAEEEKCFFTCTASKDLKVSRIPLGIGISPQGKSDQHMLLLQVTSAVTCDLLIFQWLSIGLSSVVPPGAGAGTMTTKNPANHTHCHAECWHGCTHH